ncbi:MAG: T9SS type A sorting domain-containing protein [Saprospiraceae bacterium]|nr:T9SS type A sorting domain-containing protein [Saprospiraceae bacterium]
MISTSLQPCSGQNNGQINLTVSGGIPPYTYAWSDAPPNGVTNTRTQLMAGNYVSTVIDYCGAKVVTTIPLTPMQVNAFTLTPACQNQGTGAILVANGNPGYTYYWNTNPTQTAASVQNLRSGNICVTVTDNRGCKLTRCGELRNKEYQIVEENRPCEGFNDGSLKLKAYNPLAELVQITLDGQAQPLLDPFATEISHLVPNLSSGGNYSLVVTIGACSYTYPFIMQHKPVSNVFDHYTNGICYYDVYCGPNFVADDGYQQPPWMNFSDVNGGWLTRCSVNTYCGNTEVDDIKYSKKWVKAFIYYQILLDALVNSPHSSDYINALIDFYNNKGLKYCDKVRYCPANLKITSTFPGTHGQAISSGNCWSLDCNWPVGDESFCVPGVVPNYFYSSGNPINPSLPPVYLCEPRTYSLYQLINWKADLLATYPNFLGSELHGLVTQWESVEPVDPRIYCASVAFCLTDFKVLYNNVESIDCSPCPSPSYVYSYGEPAPDPCSPYETSALTKVYCKGSLISNSGCSCCLFPVTLVHGFPGQLFFAPPPNDGLPPIRTDHGLPDRADEFVNFGEAYADGTLVPKGLFKNRQGKGLYYDYFPHNASAERETIPNVKFSLEDVDNNSLAYVSKEDGVPIYYLNYEDTIQDWAVPIGSNGFLDVSHLSREGMQLVVAGRFMGTLIFGDQQVANAPSISAFVLRVSNASSLTATRTVTNFDGNFPLMFERSGGDLLISGRTGTSALGTDGQAAIIGSQPGQYFTLRDQMNASVYQYQSNTLNVSSGMTLLKTAYSHASGNRAYLFAGAGAAQVNSQTIAQPTANQLTLLNLAPAGTLVWANTVNISSYNVAELDLTEGGDGSFFLGLTFTDTLTASGQLAVSTGGKDVAILRYGLNGALTGIQSFGSKDDEEVKRCVFSGGNIYFGGNYRGLTFERLIGSNIYQNYPSDSVYSKAYITFLPTYMFEDSTGHRLIVNSPRKPVATSMEVRAHPNPFTDKIQVSLHSNVVAEHTVQLVNALGMAVWQRRVTVAEGQNVFAINDLQTLPTGLYVLRILSAEGPIYIHKMQKQ